MKIMPFKPNWKKDEKEFLKYWTKYTNGLELEEYGEEAIQLYDYTHDLLDSNYTYEYINYLNEKHLKESGFYKEWEKKHPHSDCGYPEMIRAYDDIENRRKEAIRVLSSAVKHYSNEKTNWAIERALRILKDEPLEKR